MTPPVAPYRMRTSHFGLCPVRRLARQRRTPPPFVTPAKAGVHSWLRMLPQPVESRANRLRLPRNPRLDPDGVDASIRRHRDVPWWCC